MSAEASASSETESSEEFFDAEDVTPKSRGSSLKRQPSSEQTPKITISRPPRPESLTFEVEHDNASKNTAKTTVLPDEITRELEALSQVDDDRNSRIAKLEKLRRKGDFDSDEEDEGGSGIGGGQAKAQSVNPNPYPESAESSVEGIYLSGQVRQSHPFKVIEPEPDRRSVCSESRSSQGGGRSSVPKSIIHETNSRADSLAKLSSQLHHSSRDEIVPPIYSWQGSSQPVPDIVSSLGHKLESEVIMGPPNRPPRRTKKKSVENFQPSPTSVMTEGIEPPVRRQEVSPIFSKNLSSSYLHTSTPRFSNDHNPLPSPASTVASLTRDLEDTLTLDLQAAMRGQYVVKPQDDENSRGEASFQEFQRSILTSSSIEEEPETIAPLKENSLERQVQQVQGAACSSKFSNSDRKSLKSGNGSGGTRRSSSTIPPPLTNLPVNSQSLGSNYASATSGSSNSGTGGKKSLHSGGSMDSSTARDFSGLTKQMNMFLRTRSDSGKKLNDEEILKQIKVKNLDTGQEMDLVEAEDQLPASVNPLSLHIMRLTNEYVSGDRSQVKSMSMSAADSDTESLMSSVSSYTLGGKKKKNSVKKFFGSMAKKTSDAAKSLTIESARKKVPKENSLVIEKDVEKIGRLATEIKSSEGVPQQSSRDGKNVVFKRIQAHRSGPFDFEGIKFAQELSSTHLGPIWCMKFSQCGQLLATAGQDTILTIWVLKQSYNYFADMRSRYNADNSKSSPTNSYENVISDISEDTKKSGPQVFMDVPFCQYRGHTSDLLDVSWSKNYFILTSSMDKTVRLWHISRRECLCCFQHIDFVTAICFHPRNDQFFLSGSLDGKLRLWNIPDKKVALWNEVDGASKLITTANFIQNGKFAVVGTYDGRCIFYSTDQLKYYTMIHVRSARGKNAQGRKVTGIEPMPGEDKILVTSNDSRIRLYDLRDLSLSCKYKGYVNSSSQIRASFSHDGKYISAGSENQCVFLWRTHYEPSNLTVRKDRNSYYEAIKAHNALVTCSVFAPNPQLVFDQLDQTSSSSETLDRHIDGNSKFNTNSSFKKDKNPAKDSKSNPGPGYVVISGDYDGEIKVFYNAVKPKHSSLPS